MVDEKLYVRDFHTRVLKRFYECTDARGYVSPELPFIPELFMENSRYIPEAMAESDRESSVEDRLCRHMYVAFFGGLAGTYFWYFARDRLLEKGLFRMCTELRPLYEIDQMTYGLMGMPVDRGEFEFKELFYELYWSASEELESAEPELRGVLEERLGKIFFHVGLSVGLAKLGKDLKE